MKKCLFWGACLVALASSPVLAQAGGATVVVVRVYDNGGNVHLTISRGEGKPELVTFTSGNSDKHLMETADGYQRVLAKLYQEGYSLKSTFTVSPTLATLLFVKGQ